MSEEIVYSFIVRDVSVTMDDKHIQSELQRRYHGVAQVTRLYFKDEEGAPKTSVQVDFTTSNDAKQILRDGSIVIGGICRQVRAIKRPPYQRFRQRSSPNRFNTNQSLSEQDLIDMFEEQKQILTNVINSFEDKLNSAITYHQTKQQTVLSTNAQ